MFCKSFFERPGARRAASRAAASAAAADRDGAAETARHGYAIGILFRRIVSAGVLHDDARGSGADTRTEARGTARAAS